MNNEITLTYNAQVTRIIKPVDKSEAKRLEALLMNKDLSELEESIKSRLGVDDVRVENFKTFVGAFTE